MIRQQRLGQAERPTGADAIVDRLVDQVRRQVQLSDSRSDSGTALGDLANGRSSILGVGVDAKWLVEARAGSVQAPEFR